MGRNLIYVAVFFAGVFAMSIVGVISTIQQGEGDDDNTKYMAVFMGVLVASLAIAIAAFMKGSSASKVSTPSAAFY